MRSSLCTPGCWWVFCSRSRSKCELFGGTGEILASASCVTLQRPSDLMAYLKSLRPVYSFLEVATESFMQHVSFFTISCGSVPPFPLPAPFSPVRCSVQPKHTTRICLVAVVVIARKLPVSVYLGLMSWGYCSYSHSLPSNLHATLGLPLLGVQILELPPAHLAQLLRCVEDGLCAQETVLMQSCATLGHFVEFIFKYRNSE